MRHQLCKQEGRKATLIKYAQHLPNIPRTAPASALHASPSTRGKRAPTQTHTNGVDLGSHAWPPDLSTRYMAFPPAPVVPSHPRLKRPIRASSKAIVHVNQVVERTHGRMYLRFHVHNFKTSRSRQYCRCILTRCNANSSRLAHCATTCYVCTYVHM